MINYLSKTKSAIIIQSLWRGYKCRSDYLFFINNIIIKNIKNNNIEHNNFFIKCMKIMKKYNPSKNEYKFIYGNLIQKSLIEFLNNIFYSCIDLDNLLKNGSQYKVDCNLKLTKNVNFYISIKAKKNKNGKIILINKFKNDREYNLDNLVTFLIILETKEIIIIPHSIVPKKYLENNDANICYKSSILSLFYKTYKNYIISLDENLKFINFVENNLKNIQIHDIYKELYDNL